jgi:hypothetical protein
MLEIAILPVAACVLDELANPLDVLRMGPLDHRLDGRDDRAIHSEDAKGLVRPDESARRAPAEAAGVAEPLGFRQICLFGGDLGGSVPAITCDHEDNQHDGDHNAAGHDRGREDESQGGIGVDPRP